MIDLKPIAADNGKASLYQELLQMIDVFTADERDSVANMANTAALLWQYLPDINWVGFYRAVDGGLVLGPFQGKVACVRIAYGTGVCGTAAATRQTQRTDNVHAFSGHIACDAASESELVIPLVADNQLIGVLDIDCPTVARFDAVDQGGMRSDCASAGRTSAVELSLRSIAQTKAFRRS
jgi:L-methionine (R)-S-oxide reductase